MRKHYLRMIATLLIGATMSSAQATNDAQREQLGRGLIVNRATKGNFISWRLLATDDKNTTFDLLRDSMMLKSNIATATNYTDTYGTAVHKYQVVTKQNGEPIDTTEAVSPWTDYYYQLHSLHPLQRVLHRKPLCFIFQKQVQPRL